MRMTTRPSSFSTVTQADSDLRHTSPNMCMSQLLRPLMSELVEGWASPLASGIYCAAHLEKDDFV